MVSGGLCAIPFNFLRNKTGMPVIWSDFIGTNAYAGLVPQDHCAVFSLHRLSNRNIGSIQELILKAIE